MFFFTLLLPILFGSVFTLLNPDEITDLPGLNPDEITDLPGLNYNINFRQYSGYLAASRGRFLHYWFVESQNNPRQDPLLLWLNGGPGCSSLDGLLSELGPFRVQNDGKTLSDNPFTWNKVANIIFLESPAGVGFSYSTTQNYSTNDNQTSLDNYIALQHFFTKFPQFQKNDFYVTGESYAGIYIPTLSVRILSGRPRINFKGIAIASGYLDVKKLDNSVLPYAYKHALLDSVIWNELVNNCCNGTADRCDFQTASQNSKKCYSTVCYASSFVVNSGLNTYNIYSDCTNTSFTKETSDQCDRKNVFQFFPDLGTTAPCTDSSTVTSYLNQQSVREALHIPPFVQEWTQCSTKVDYKQLYNTMRPQILTLLGSGRIRILIFNGDVDLVTNFLGDEWFVEGLGLQNVTRYQPWYFNNQVAGFYKNYQNLTFLTVRGSGHLIPTDKPGPALKVISSFLSNQPY